MRTSLPILILAVVLSSCFGWRELPVEYDYSYSARFKNYKTFDMFERPSIDKDSSMYREIIEQTIINRMNILGYKRNKKKPNLLISYRLFYDSLNFNGYDQPDIEDWVLNKTREKEEYNEKDYAMKEGTLLIQFFDRKLQKSICKVMLQVLLEASNTLRIEIFVMLLSQSWINTDSLQTVFLKMKSS